MFVELHFANQIPPPTVHASISVAKIKTAEDKRTPADFMYDVEIESLTCAKKKN